MRIKDMAILFPKAVISGFLKMGRVELNDQLREEILENGLYYFAKDEKSAEQMKEQQYLKPEKRIIKPYVCFFGGMPNIEQYMQNSGVEQNENPYLNPAMVVYAIKVSPTKKEELANYKVRGWADNAIIYEGYCVLPEQEIESVCLVPDLVRDSNGKPIRNERTGRYDVAFRKAKQEELESYKAADDYLQFMEDERQRLGYLSGDEKESRRVNKILTELHFGTTEWKKTFQSINTFFTQMAKRKIEQMRRQKLEISIDEILKNYTHEKKNPYRCQEFAEAAARFLKEGLEQLELKQELQNLTTSDIGKYFREKCRKIDKKPIIPRGIHGINHNNRVAILAMLIAQNEGIFQEDDDNRKKDILLTAAYYHDIGRKKGIITDNWGPHGKNSARKVGKMNLAYANGKGYSPEDKSILQAVIEAHEGMDDEMDGICEKYEISSEGMEDVKKLMRILKDADALDRVRTDINLPVVMRTDLRPKYLRTDTSKRLLDASYQLEKLVGCVEFNSILEYKIPRTREYFLQRISNSGEHGVTPNPRHDGLTNHSRLKVIELQL